MTAARANGAGGAARAGKRPHGGEQGRPDRKPAAGEGRAHNAEAANPAPRPHPRREGAGDAGQGAADAAGGGRRAPSEPRSGARSAQKATAITPGGSPPGAPERGGFR